MSEDTADSAPLFRQEAINRQRGSQIGTIVLTPRLSSLWLSIIAALLGLLVIAFVLLGSYTRRVMVNGQLVPAAGVIRVHTQQLGVVLEKHVNDGQEVKKGDVLYVLSSDRLGDDAREVQADIARAIGARRQSLQDDMRRSRQVQQEELMGLQRRQESLRQETGAIAAQITQQKDRLRLAEDTERRYRGLADQDFIAREEYLQKQIDVSEQRSRLRGLERDSLAVQRELTQVRQDLDSAQSRNENQLAQIEREISSTEEQLTEVQARRRVLVTAPEAGRATLVQTEVGQVVDVSQALVTLVPLHSDLRARLYAPSSSIGFAQPGDKVLLRYQAFPYQKFGQHEGVVESVSTSAVAPLELEGLPNIGLEPKEAVFAIQVRLPSGQVMANGSARALQAGMALEADILQERRRIYEWMLEPLFSVTARMAE